MKLKEFEKHLTKHGCKLLREGGNHSIWINTDNNLFIYRLLVTIAE
jgi:predicted RNA binding protein YcfA (HicA-like mRNA interferase family)